MRNTGVGQAVVLLTCCEWRKPVLGSNPRRLLDGEIILLLKDKSSFRTQDAALQACPGSSWANFMLQLYPLFLLCNTPLFFPQFGRVKPPWLSTVPALQRGRGLHNKAPSTCTDKHNLCSSLINVCFPFFLVRIFTIKDRNQTCCWVTSSSEIMENL